MTDYFRKKVTINSEEDLYELHQKDSKAQADKYFKQTGHKALPIDFYTWIGRRGICPYGIISSNTKYWLELLSVYDGEMGMNMPFDYDKMPSIFFDVLRIYRDSKPSVETPKDNNASKNN